MSARIYQTLQRAIGAALIVRERLNLWEWSDRYVSLDARFTARPGKYDSAYTYYIRGPMEALSDRRVRQVTVVKGAQIAFTTMLANWVMYLGRYGPGADELSIQMGTVNRLVSSMIPRRKYLSIVGRDMVRRRATIHRESLHL